MPSTITAIIPTYNRAAMLRECIDSVLAQTRPVDEIIVVNDGSTDDTESIVKSYDDRITLISKKNGGKSSALNLALAQCTSDYIWICDDDDIAATDGLESLATALDADDTAGFVFGTFKIFHDTAGGRIYTPPTYWKRDEEPSAKMNFFEGMFTFQFAMLVRRSLYNEVGRFREDLIRSGDYDMAIRLCRENKAVYVPKVIFFQRAHEGVRGSRLDSFNANENIKKWLQYDQKIFSWIRENYNPEEFTPTFAEQWDGVRAHRSALVKRACAFAARALWNDAISDFRHAITSSPASAAPEELRMAEVAIRDILPWLMLGDNLGWVADLRACYRENGYGRRIIHATCRPLVWHARSMFQKGDIKVGIRMLRIMVSVLGIRGTLNRVSASLFG